MAEELQFYDGRQDVKVSAANPLPTTATASLSAATGAGTEAAALRVTLATDSTSNAEYETVAASQTTQALGATGASGDYLAGVLVVPATTAPGIVTVLDNTTAVVSFPGGTLPSVIPFFIPLGIKSVSGAWKVTTGANVSVVGVGNFT